VKTDSEFYECKHSVLMTGASRALEQNVTMRANIIEQKRLRSSVELFKACVLSGGGKRAENAGVENAGVDNTARSDRGGKPGSGQRGTR